VKKAVLTALIIFTASLASLYGQEADYELTLDFSVEQTNLPYPSYAAAYLVNTTDTPLVFSAGSMGWDGMVVLIGTEGEQSFNEMVEVVSNVKVTTTLQPKEKIKIFSEAFSLETRTKYINSYLLSSVFINGKKKAIKAYFSPDAAKK